MSINVQPIKPIGVIDSVKEVEKQGNDEPMTYDTYLVKKLQDASNDLLDYQRSNGLPEGTSVIPYPNQIGTPYIPQPNVTPLPYTLPTTPNQISTEPLLERYTWVTRPDGVVILVDTHLARVVDGSAYDKGTTLVTNTNTTSVLKPKRKSHILKG